MSLTVLVPLDGSDRSWKALDHAIEHFDESSITVIHVVDPTATTTVADTFGGYYDEKSAERARDQAEDVCAEARKRAEQAGFDTTKFEAVIETGRPARAVIEYVENRDVDHVVMGSRGLTGIKRILLGSVAENVVRRSPVPVTVVR